jgi:hypothetical protein
VCMSKTNRRDDELTDAECSAIIQAAEIAYPDLLADVRRRMADYHAREMKRAEPDGCDDCGRLRCCADH